MSDPIVYVTRQLPAPAMEILRSSCTVRLWDHESDPVPREVLLRELADADGLVSLLTERIDRELVDAAPRLRVVSTVAAGYDNVDVEALTRRGIVLTNTPNVLTETTADLVWALMLAGARRIVEGSRVIEQDRWATWSPMFMAGQDVHGATLGLVGAGRIGMAVARRAIGFGMPLIYHNRSRSQELEAATGAQYASLSDLLQSADFVVCLAPLTEDTRGMFGARQFAQMKPTAVFVNAARGLLVVEADLIEALKLGRPWAAALDVFETEPIGSTHPLVGLDNVTVVPHIGSATVRTRTAMAMAAATSMVAALRGDRPVANVVIPPH